MIFVSQNIPITSHSTNPVHKFIGLNYLLIRRNLAYIIFIFDTLNDHVFCPESRL